MQKPKGQSSHYTWIAFSQVVRDDSYVSIMDTDVDSSNETDELIVSLKEEQVSSPLLNPEQLVVKRELFRKLSDESKYVVQLVLDAPAELLTPKTGNVTRVSVQKYLGQYLGWNPSRICRVFSELKTLVSNFVE